MTLAGTATPTPSPAVAATCPLLAAPTSAAPSQPYVPSSWYEGADGLSRAQRDLQPARVPTILYFFTTWCPYCRSFEQDVLTSSEAERALRGPWVRVRVNPEETAADRTLGDRYGVSGFPTVLLLLGEENLGRVSTRSASAFVQDLERLHTAWLERQLGDARRARQAGDSNTAVELLDRLLELQPETARALIERGLARGAINDSEGALDDLRRAVALEPDELSIFQALDLVLTPQQRWDEIAACWTHSLERQPGHAAALFARAWAYSRKGDRERAAADARAACERGETRACEALKQR